MIPKLLALLLFVGAVPLLSSADFSSSRIFIDDDHGRYEAGEK